MEATSAHNNNPLDISKFEDLTNNSASIKEEILELFFLNTSECLKLMERSVNDNVWFCALKEISALAKCIGAEQICKTCSVAKTTCVDSIENRRKVCSNLDSNLEILKVFVRNTSY